MKYQIKRVGTINSGPSLSLCKHIHRKLRAEMHHPYDFFSIDNHKLYTIRSMTVHG